MGAGHAHNHNHNHSHSHSHETSGDYNTAFMVGIGLNLVYVIIEAIFGFYLDSLALLTDAGHNLSDVASLILAWVATALAKKKPFGQFTYGLKRTTIIVAFANSLLLVLAMGGIAWEAILRFKQPTVPEGFYVSLVAGIGILINTGSAWLFNKGKEKDLNIRSAFQHLFADALVSAGVVIAGIVMHYTNIGWLDSAISLIIVAVVLFGTWQLIFESAQLILDAAPKNVSVIEVREYLNKLEGVSEIHDLHIWNLSTNQVALTTHLIIPNYSADNTFLQNVQKELKTKFHISHATIQIETGKEGIDAFEC